MSRHILCLGALNLDLHFEAPDPEGFLAAWGTGLTRGGREVLSTGEEQRLTALLPRFARGTGRAWGGAAARAAYALARLEVPVVLLGRVGADEDGFFIKKNLPGVNLEHLVTAGASGRSYVLKGPGGEPTRLTAPNTNDLLNEADLPLEVVAGSAFLHLTGLTGEGPLKAEGQILQRLAGQLRVCFEPGELGAPLGRQALTPILDHTETLVVTAEEWELLGGELRGHANWAPPVVLVKRGNRGTRMLTPVRYLDFPSYLHEDRVDARSADDVLAAGYLAGLFTGLNLPQAVRLASALAAYALGGEGGKRDPDRRVMEGVISSLR